MTTIIQVATLLGALITIGTLVYTGYQLFWAKVTFYRIHDPSKPVSDRTLSYADVEKGLEILVKAARTFKPDVILGINRGGAIVGGCIAKKLGIPAVHVININCDAEDDARVNDSHVPPLDDVTNVLLVDDAMRKGEHMREAKRYLEKKPLDLNIHRAVLLKMTVPHHGPERESFSNVSVETEAFVTEDAKVLLPWDP